MAPSLQDFTSPPQALLDLLSSHLPHSLPVLRRLQFARLHMVPSPDPHIFFASNASYDLLRDWPAAPPGHFAAAFMDLTRGPEEEMWLYSTLQDDGESKGLENKDHATVNTDGDDSTREGAEQVRSIMRRVRTVEAHSTNERRPQRGWVMLATLNERLRQAMIGIGMSFTKTRNVPADVDWMFEGKWLFRLEGLPSGGWEPQQEGMRWDVVRLEDTELICSRTSIPRKGETLVALRNRAVRRDDGVLIAWAFLGLDGSLITLHCEPPYRGRGIARALASRLLRDYLKDYGDDGWCAADVIAGNTKSERVCQSLGARRAWTVSWCMLDLSTVGDPS